MNYIVNLSNNRNDILTILTSQEIQDRVQLCIIYGCSIYFYFFEETKLAHPN
jgi:hypothetical protein